MAKFECVIPGTYDFDETLKYFHDHLLRSRSSALFKDGSDIRTDGRRVAVRVYERYTAMGDNRLSLSLTLVERNDGIFVSAISAAGSGGIGTVFNWGEDEFVEWFVEGANMFEGVKPVTSADL